MAIAVYTTDYGDYAYHYTPPKQTVDADYYIFTDNPDLKSEGWQTIYKPLCLGYPRMNHKFAKFSPHYFLPTYTQTIWIDLGWQFTTPDFVAMCVSYLNEDSYIVSGSNRNSIQQEIQAARTCWKYDQSQIDLQEKDYVKAGFPETCKMYGTGIIIRDNSEKAKRIDTEVWNQSCQYGALCQAVLPFAIWKTGDTITTFRDEDIAPRVKRVGHAHNVA